MNKLKRCAHVCGVPINSSPILHTPLSLSIAPVIDAVHNSQKCTSPHLAPSELLLSIKMTLI